MGKALDSLIQRGVRFFVRQLASSGQPSSRRDEDAYFGEIDDRKPDSKVMPLIQQLIKKQARHWDSKLVSDPVQHKLLEIIEAKRKKMKRPAKAKASEPEATPNNVVNIMDALRRSVKAEKRPGKPN